MVQRPDKRNAESMDQQDPIHRFRERFRIPPHGEEESTYFLGNSLGLQPVVVKTYIDRVLLQWQRYGVEAFFKGDHPWLDFHGQLTGSLGHIIGALPEEISVMNQLTVNLHLMLVSFYRPEGKRIRILCEQKAFSSDQYMMDSHVRHHGLDPDQVILEINNPIGESCLRTEDILDAIDRHHDELALVLLGGVNYYTGQVLDMQAITAAARKYGIKVGFDLAHAVGNIHLALHEWDVDFACWCSYKYLNGGPGAVGGAFIHQRHHQNKDFNRFAGWFGHEKESRFRMDKVFQPIPSAEGWQLSTPSPILYASLMASLDIIEEAGWGNLLEKQAKMQQYLWQQLTILPQFGKAFQILTPQDARGCQISLYFPVGGRRIFESLEKKGFMVDWREPNVIRLAPVPLYNTFTEIWAFTEALRTSI